MTVSINGTLLPATISADGTSWSLALSAADLKALPDGEWTIGVTVKDAVGNTATDSSLLTVAINNVPAPTISAPFFDSLLNIAEAGVDQVLRGSTGVLGAGQKVMVSIDNAAAVAATVNANGSWSLDLSSDFLKGLANGEHTIVVVATDVYGNTAQVGDTFDSLLTAPLPTITIPFGDGLGISEAAGVVTITGKTGITPVAGQDQNVTLKVDVNGVVYNGTVDANGDWTVTLPAGALNGLSNTTHQIIVTVTDAAGNVGTTTGNFDAYLTLPQPTLQVPFENGYLNEDVLLDETILSGTTGAVGAGQIVTVTFGNLTALPAVVNPDGTWSLTLSPSELADIQGQLGQNQHGIIITVTDPGGNTNTLNETFIIDTLPPLIDELVFAGDNTLTYAESLSTQTLTGTSGINDVGSTVTLTIGTQSLYGVIGADGKWSINVNPAALQALIAAGGAYSVDITDAAGNFDIVSGTVNLNVNPTGDALVTLAPVNGDGIINASDPLTTTLSGALINVPLTVGGSITITVGATWWRPSRSAIRARTIISAADRWKMRCLAPGHSRWWSPSRRIPAALSRPPAPF